MTYISGPDLAGYTRNGIVADSDEIDAAVITACQAVDVHCGRTFTVPTVATTRTFLATGGEWVEIDDIASTAGVLVDGAATAGLRVGAEIPGPWAAGRVWPYRWVKAPSTAGAEFTVTALFGWPATPPEVPLAAKLLAKDILASRDVSFGAQTFGPEAFARRITGNSQVVAMLRDLCTGGGP